MEQYNVFISYSRKDSEKVLSVVKKLQDRGFTIWIDKDGIESGDSFKSVIVHAIKNSDIFLFFSSKDSNASSWTVKEVNTAVHLKKSIIPVRLDDTDYDDSILFDLGSLDFVDLSSEEKREAALNKLINTLLRKSVPLEMGVEINNVDEYDTSLLADDCYNQGVLSFESQNYMEAADWFKKAANKGHSRAQCFLGYLYENGIGVEKSDIEAVNWYAKAAEQGETLAQNNLGSMYREGKGVQRNVDEAARWFRVAAGQGHVLAQYNLAIMYQIGAGVKQDEAEAVKWYREAANQGLPQAQYSLGNMYRTGNGMKEKDEREAVEWFKKAAEQGLADAQYNLGYMYYNGCGVEKDVDEAVQWLNKAAAQGHSGAKGALKMILGSSRITN